MTDASPSFIPRDTLPGDRALMRRLGLPGDALPAGGNWYPEDKTLEAALDVVEACRPRRALVLGGGLSAAVLARVMVDISEL